MPCRNNPPGVRKKVTSTIGAIFIVPPVVAVVICWICYDETVGRLKRRKKWRQKAKRNRGPPRPPKPDQYERLNKIEKATGRIVSIEATKSEATLSKCAAQDKSPLFSVLPAEIRLLIFEFVLCPSEKLHDLNRPSPRRHQRCSYELLLTCRLIWLEANAFGLRQAEPAFIQDRVISQPIHNYGPEKLGSSIETLTQNNVPNLNRIRIISTTHWLTDHTYVDAIERLANSPWQPRSLRVSLWFIDPDPDGMPPSVLDSLNGAVRSLLNSASGCNVQDLELELVARVDEWTFPREQIVEQLRVDRQYLNHAPGWSLVSTSHAFEDASQSRSGLSVVTNSFAFRRVWSQHPRIAENTHDHVEASDLGDPCFIEIRDTKQTWNRQQSLLTLKARPVSVRKDTAV